MKIRNGFVSNSSSSSFVVYGVKITDDEETKINNFEGLTIEDDRYFFDGEQDGYIIGLSGGGLSDGEVCKLKNFTEEDKVKLIEKLKLNGIERKIEDIHYYVQYISNDNY